MLLVLPGEGDASQLSAPRCCDVPQRSRVAAGDTAATTLPRVMLTSAEIAGAEGYVDLLPVRSPFGVAVTVDGSQRYGTRVMVRGLPDPASLGPYTTYVLWSATWLVQQTERLGVVTDGERSLGEVHWNKFRFLITAESSPEVDAPSGPVVLRGSSPSGRMFPHDFCHLGYGGPC